MVPGLAGWEPLTKTNTFSFDPKLRFIFVHIVVKKEEQQDLPPGLGERLNQVLVVIISDSDFCTLGWQS